MAAIYQWFPVEEMLLTTTLYPIEVSDSVQFECNIDYGEMLQIPGEEHQQSGTLSSIELYQILLSYGPDNEDHKQSGTLSSVVLNQILITYPADNEEHRQSGDLTSIVLNLKLVTVDTPDEKLQLDCDIYPPDCSMSDI